MAGPIAECFSLVRRVLVVVEGRERRVLKLEEGVGTLKIKIIKNVCCKNINCYSLGAIGGAIGIGAGGIGEETSGEFLFPLQFPCKPAAF